MKVKAPSGKVVGGILVMVLIIIIIIVILSQTLMKSTPPPPDSMVLLLKEELKKVDPTFVQIDIRAGTSAYTENKSVIYMCVKDPETGQYYSMNTLVYVALHEIAHVKNRSYGHDESFKRVFSNLLNRAQQAGIYNPAIPIPPSYCGIDG